MIDGDPKPGLPKSDLLDNPFWPAELSAGPKLPHERCLTLLPLALSRTLDDKGRVRWTLFGNSEQGPSRAFWRSFSTAPGVERPAADALGFFARLLGTVYGEKVEGAAELRKAGFRILPDGDEALPSWADEFRLGERPGRAGIRHLLTFRPFGLLPAAVRKAYLAGELCLLARAPASLAFFGVPGYRQLARELPLAGQIPLLFGVPRHRMPGGVKVPQCGFLHEATEGRPHARDHAGHVRNGYKRTHRWDKILRDAGRTRPHRPRRPSSSTCCSAPSPTTCRSTASRWPGTSNCGRRTIASCSTGRTPRPTRSSTPCATARSGRRCSATASSSRPCASADTRSTGTGRWSATEISPAKPASCRTPCSAT